MTKYSMCVMTILTTMVIAMGPALADSYITISAEDAGEEYAVTCVWDEEGYTAIGVRGNVEFTINVSESYPYGIDTCWIYLNGTTTTDTSLDFTVEDYRQHYGAAVIKYTDDTYECAEFHIQPHWPLDAMVQTGAEPPSSISLPEDETAAELIEPIAEADPYGPTQCDQYCVCEGPGCFDKIATAAECASYVKNSHDCWDDQTCMEKE